MATTMLEPIPAEWTAFLQRRLTFEEFVEEIPDEMCAEWVDGRAVLMTTPSIENLAISNFLLTTLTLFAEDRNAGRVFCERCLMRTGPDLPGRVPDVLFVAREHDDRFRKNYLDGPADLAVEIVSPHGRVRDRIHKYAEYERGGVREYWLIEPETREASFHVLDEDGRYRERPLASDGRYHSTVLEGLWLDPAWLWERPTAMTILKAWGIA
ncbi:MAG: Uma2 family endonuclease [Planctomycetes bacterium]|nr:Uma2 family endonuclease [Planctomycetota bacterium]